MNKNKLILLTVIGSLIVIGTGCDVVVTDNTLPPKTIVPVPTEVVASTEVITPTTISYFIPVGPISPEQGGDPEKIVYEEKTTTINPGESPMRTAVQAAVASIPAGGGPTHANVVYLKVDGSTAYVMLDIDFDGWAGMGIFLETIHPVITKNILQFSAIKSVIFGPAPGDTKEQIGSALNK